MVRTLELVGPAGMADPKVELFDLNTGATVETIAVLPVGDSANHYRGSIDDLTPAADYKGSILDGAVPLGAVERVKVKSGNPSTTFVRAYVDTDAASGGSGVYPPENLVAEGYVYGPNGDDFTGTATDLGTIPDANDVREAVATGGTVGTIHLPPQAKVEKGYGYGANSTELTGTGCSPPDPQAPPPVMDEWGNVNLVRGDDYDPAIGPVATWEIPSDDWPADLTDAAVIFGYRGTSGANEVPCVLNGRTVTLEMTAEQTKQLQSAGDYRYDVEVTFGADPLTGKVKTLAFGTLTVLDTYTDS